MVGADRRFGAFEDLGDFHEREVFVVVQDHDRSLGPWQMLDQHPGLVYLRRKANRVHAGD
jgi:hypothetical protein